MKTQNLLSAPRACAGILVLSALAVALPARAADGHVTYLEAVGPGERPMVVAGSDRGVVFIGADDAVYRTFHHTQSAPEGVEQPFLWVTDIDGDSRDEYVGAGTPSFVIDDNADPMWGVGEGCDQYFLADFIDDRNQEVFCRTGRQMRVWSYDGQPYYEWAGSGYSFETCFADDFDDDRKHEVACGLTNGNHLVFDLDYMDPEEREGPAPEALNRGGVDRSALAAAAAGEHAVSLGGQDVTLSFVGGNLTLTAGEAVVATLPLGTTGVYSALAADLDGDGTDSLYVGGDDAVFVISAAGELTATVPADPNATRRDARVEIRSATANGLENSDRDAVRAIVDGGVSDLVSCYVGSMGRDQFTRVGTMLWELTIDGDGDVSSSSRRHSDLRNDSLEGCVEDALEDLEFSPAAGGSGSVAITLKFDFVDVP